MNRLQIYNPETVKLAAEAIAADIAACPSCKTGTPVSHCTSYIYNGTLYTRRCDSGSRWFNPATMQMEGRRHCTCDYCF